MTNPLLIADCDPPWPQGFEKLRSRGAAALGPLAAAIEHVGSTTVPGLAAMTIIDIVALITHGPNCRSSSAGLLRSDMSLENSWASPAAR